MSFKLVIVRLTLLAASVFILFLTSQLNQLGSQFTMNSEHQYGLKLVTQLVSSNESSISKQFNKTSIMVYGQQGSGGLEQRQVSSSKSPTHQQQFNKTYVMVLSLDGQQGSGVRSLSVFQCFLSAVYDHFYVVEPHIVNSHLQGFATSNSTLKFSALFDFEYFNEKSRQIGLPEMATMNEFSKFTQKKFIYVFVSLKEADSIVWTSSNGRNCLEEDNTTLSKMLQRVALQMRKVKKLASGVGCTVRVVKLKTIHIRAWNGLSDHPIDSVYKLIFGEWSPQRVAVVFHWWYNKIYLPIDSPLSGIDCLQVYSSNEIKAQFEPSKKLLQDVERYESMFLGNQTHLAVMMRMERVITTYHKEKMKHNNQPNSLNLLKECLDEVVTAVGEVQNSTRPLVTMDVGQFGSSSYGSKNYKDLSLKTLKTISHNRWSLSEWENSFVKATGGLKDKGYIAALQRMLASRADCLVLMGGGSFQTLAVVDYFRYHMRTGSAQSCIRLVCVMTEYNVEVQNVIKRFKSQTSVDMPDNM